jgi:iron complex transport system substrate-binding protein
MEIDEITGIIIDRSIKIHRDLGPGLLESVYEAILEKELLTKGL